MYGRGAAARVSLRAKHHRGVADLVRLHGELQDASDGLRGRAARERHTRRSGEQQRGARARLVCAVLHMHFSRLEYPVCCYCCCVMLRRAARLWHSSTHNAYTLFPPRFPQHKGRKKQREGEGVRGGGV